MNTEYINQFIISVRTKDGNEYEPTFLRSLVASLKRQLKKKGYSASITNDLVFEKTREVLYSKQKQLKKQGKVNKPTGPVALTSDELKTLFPLDYFRINCRLGDFKPLFVAFIAPLHLCEINLSIKHYHEKNLSTYDINTLQHGK